MRRRIMNDNEYREDKWWIVTILIFVACLLFWMAVIDWVI